MNEDEALHTYELDPRHPPVHLALAGLQKNLLRADFLRQDSPSRLCGDPKLRERAAAFLLGRGKEDPAQEVTGRGKP
jgi:hypothetical protein